MILVDTSIIALPILESVTELTRKELRYLDLLKEFEPFEIYLPDFILTELSVLIYKSFVKRAKLEADTLKLFVQKSNILFKSFSENMIVISATREELSKAIKLFTKTNLRKNGNNLVSLQDILLVVIAESRGLNLMSADKHIHFLASKYSIKQI